MQQIQSFEKCRLLGSRAVFIIPGAAEQKHQRKVEMKSQWLKVEKELSTADNAHVN